MNSHDKTELQISEEQDGSATVLMPGAEKDDHDEHDNDDSNDGRREKDSRLGESDDDHDADDGDDIDPDPKREAIRQARREERRLKKQLHREKAKESNHLINMLKKQNSDMAERIAALEKRTTGADVARLDKAIEDAHLRVNYAKLKIAEGTKNGDGNAVVQAQEAWFEARRNVESLEALKKKVEAEPKQSAVPQTPDPRLKKYASDWMDRNDWYDPNGKNTDSKIAVKVDEELAEEGWDPNTEEYWDELDTRLQKYLPHRYEREASKPTRRPRAAVTGSGRESSPSARPGEFRLSPERVRAIKDAGKWDDPVERQKMVRRYAEYDRNLGVR